MLTRGDSTERIHFVRVQCKRLRAVLELIRSYISESKYGEEKRRIKAVAQELTAIRDSHVLRETLESAADVFGRNRRRKYGDWIGSALPKRSVPSDRQACRQTYPLLRRAMAGLPRPNGTATETDLREFSLPGLRSSYRRARAGMFRSKQHPQPESFHRWRKSAKCLVLQLELLHRAGLPVNRTVLRRFDALQRDLGNHRDLLLAESFQPTGEQIPKALRKVIRKRRKHLEADLLRRGKRLFSGNARDFLKATLRNG
jgi:CHAD domain-containing protein